MYEGIKHDIKFINTWIYETKLLALRVFLFLFFLRKLISGGPVSERTSTKIFIISLLYSSYLLWCKLEVAKTKSLSIDKITNQLCLSFHIVKFHQLRISTFINHTKTEKSFIGLKLLKPSLKWRKSMITIYTK